MRHSRLNESCIYAVKRVIDEITKIDFEDKRIISFDLSELPDQSEIPDAIQLEKQIIENLDKCSSNTKYIDKLIDLFPYLYESISFLTEEKYRVKSSMDFLMREMGYLVDFNKRGGENWQEKGLRYFYFGENYEKLNGIRVDFSRGEKEELEKLEGLEELEILKYLKKQGEKITRGYVMTPFQEKAYLYFRSDGGVTLDEKDEEILIYQLNLKYGLLDESYSRANALLNAADVIKTIIEGVQQQPTVEAVEPEITPVELEKVAHGVVLFHELDIIDPLKKFCKSKNPTLSDTQFADLVGSMMGFKGKQLGTVRKALSGYGQGGKSDVRSRAALGKVKGELMKLGIAI